MDIAIVTGADTPLGLRLIEGLIRQGCRVHGIGNNFSNVTFADRHFIAHAIDLSDLKAITNTAKTIIEKEQAVHILIHAIDVTPGATFEQLPIGNLEAILKVGLLGPVMLTRMVLPNLLRFRGQLINIIPANKNGHSASAVNALIEGGLREMNTTLFDQARDAGLRVTNLILRQNPVINDAAFAGKKIQTQIDPEHVARTVERLLNPNEPNVPNEIILHPRLSGTAEEALPSTALPIDPYDVVVLPPKEYFPPQQEIIPTKEPDRIDRTIPYTDEEMEEKIASAIEDYESQPKRDEEPKKNNKNKRRGRKPKDPRPEPHTPSDNSDSSDSKPNSKRSSQSKSPRGRSRKGRNRNQKDTNTTPSTDKHNEIHSDQKPALISDNTPPAETEKEGEPTKSQQPELVSKKPAAKKKASRKTTKKAVKKPKAKES